LNATVSAALSRLDALGAQGASYAFYFKPSDGAPFYQGNCERFRSASLIKVPILLAWLSLERQGLVDRLELCDLDAEPQVQGAGFSWMLASRRLPYRDVLLMMIALSDNLCTNLIIRRAGLEALQHIFREELGLRGTELQRKLMDYAARERGLDNWITPQDCIRLFECIRALPQADRAVVDEMLSVNQDDLLLRRNIPRDTLDFYHKTGSLSGLLHDWGYTREAEIFLLTERVQDEPAVFEVFGEVGRLLSPRKS